MSQSFTIKAALRSWWYPKCGVCGEHKPSWIAYATTCGDCMIKITEATNR